jgi:hypothetical protein
MYEVRSWDGLRCHGAHTKFREDWFRNSWYYTQSILKAAVLVLLMGEIYEVRRWDGFRWHGGHTKFNEDLYRRSKFVMAGYTHAHTDTKVIS